jgi:hypothetical protein
MLGVFVPFPMPKNVPIVVARPRHVEIGTAETEEGRKRIEDSRRKAEAAEAAIAREQQGELGGVIESAKKLICPEEATAAGWRCFISASP